VVTGEFEGEEEEVIGGGVAVGPPSTGEAGHESTLGKTEFSVLAGPLPSHPRPSVPTMTLVVGGNVGVEGHESLPGNGDFWYSVGRLGGPGRIG
jgi:hypothetical protein